ncbi:MAG: ATP:cob(I)alamin adenosyltransferase [Bacilli bacterium]|nr:ATP:cob(I)alamin adenosyltransferase [Bacilli bacterium]MBN2695918.1 ATP:cob(I)alamin adenosyltransferase [Bacilli bacterium]
MKIERIEQISTKKGDEGFSSDYSGKRYGKEEELFEVLGTNDELSCQLGICFHQSRDESLKEIQRHLERVNSMIATDSEHKNYQKLNLISTKEIEWLEAQEKKALDECDLGSGFTLPGSETSLTGAEYDMARSIARRAERCFFRYLRTTNRNDLGLCGKYLNRLSDYLFVKAKSLK